MHCSISHWIIFNNAFDGPLMSTAFLKICQGCSDGFLDNACDDPLTYVEGSQHHFIWKPNHWIQESSEYTWHEEDERRHPIFEARDAANDLDEKRIHGQETDPEHGDEIQPPSHRVGNIEFRQVLHSIWIRFCYPCLQVIVAKVSHQAGERRPNADKSGPAGICRDAYGVPN